MRWEERRARAVRIMVAVLLLVAGPAIVLAAVGVPPAPTDPVAIAAPVEQVGVDPGGDRAPVTVPRRASGGEREAAAPARSSVALPATRVWALLAVAVLGSLLLSVVSGAQREEHAGEITPEG